MRMTKNFPFRHFKTSPGIIRLAVMLYVCFPLSLRNLEDFIHKRGIDVSHDTVRFLWSCFRRIAYSFKLGYQQSDASSHSSDGTVLIRLTAPA